MSPGVSQKQFRVKRLKPEAYLRRRLWRTRGGAVLAVLSLGALFIADRWGILVYGGAEATRYDGRSFEVIAVIDGDTLDLDIPDGSSATTRLRLWGINTPERSRQGHPAQPGAEAATDRTRELALGQRVTLRLEPHRLRGQYGRLLVYVILPDGTILNESLLSEGLARADDRWPHREVDRYAQLQDQAQREGRGLWSEAPTDTHGP